VITGGGDLAARKARLVVAAQANVTIIAPEIDAALIDEFAKSHLVNFIYREVILADFHSARLAIIAVEDELLQKRHHAMAKKAGVLTNVVDAPALCDFTTPSIIDRNDIVVAISTNGKAPVLGRNLRENIERMLPERMSQLVSFAGRFRPAIKSKFGHQTRSFWEGFFDGPIANQVLAGDERGAGEAMMKSVNRDTAKTESGVVHIVGAGPGDPDLLTIRAHRLLQTADVILYDRLVGNKVLNLARRDAERLYVGKAKANHSVPQEKIHEKLVELAREGKNVVRLKGGDPFIFGRGGEELDALREAGIAAYITPGITAATGCAAAAGMALTHRDHAQAVTFVTGHAKPGPDGRLSEPDLDWHALAKLKNTLVIYMGVSTAAIIAQRLMSPPSTQDHATPNAGLAPDTPVAVIENGTRDNQIIARGTLASLTDTLTNAGIKGPAILVIGDVAALANADSIHELSIEQERLSA